MCCVILFIISRIGKFLETESRLAVVRGSGEGMEEIGAGGGEGLLIDTHSLSVY